MIVAGLPLELVYQLVFFGGIAVLSGEITEALGRFLLRSQAASGDLVLLLQLPAHSDLVLAVIELLRILY